MLFYRGLIKGGYLRAALYVFFIVLGYVLYLCIYKASCTICQDWFYDWCWWPGK